MAAGEPAGALSEAGVMVRAAESAGAAWVGIPVDGGVAVAVDAADVSAWATVGLC
ncbi:hypothetical protein [Nocardia cyriacigeorgica]|uniref:hypothetical protein n=1 Tax=Nocardia cyriacigeorgica TaxID=135487 RepID=UPI0013D56A76|nr:hypothetical protein [Nocardia cyriacigeorgica]